MDIAQVCKSIAEQFDHTAQSHLAILGTIALNVIMLIRVIITTRDTNIQAASVNRKLNGS